MRNVNGRSAFLYGFLWECAKGFSMKSCKSSLTVIVPELLGVAHGSVLREVLSGELKRQKILVFRTLRQRA